MSSENPEGDDLPNESFSDPVSREGSAQYSLLTEGAPSLVDRELLQHVCSNFHENEYEPAYINETIFDEALEYYPNPINGPQLIIVESECDDSFMQDDEGFLEEEEIEVEYQPSQQLNDDQMDLTGTRPSDSGMYEMENEKEGVNYIANEISDGHLVDSKPRHVYSYDVGFKRKGFEETIMELEDEINEAKEKKFEERAKQRAAEFGVGVLIASLRDGILQENQEDLDENHDEATREKVYDRMLAPQWKAPLENLVKQEMYDKQLLEKTWLYSQLFDLPAPPEHPTRIKDVQKLIRSKMPRCKICQNRFCEKILIDFHTKEKHPDAYPALELEQQREAFEMRSNEIEQNRIEELVYGGFIPPEEDYLAENVEYIVEEIPLPGELTLTGRAPRFVDKWGTILPKVRKYWKKVSPQCPFCDKRFRNEFSLKKHFYKMHPRAISPTQCLHCFKIVETRPELENHVCDLSFLCFECTPIRNLCSAIRLASHRAKFHRGANSGFKCNDCHMKFLTPRKLRKHRKMTHVFTKVFQCHFCDEHFISETSVTTHERIHTGIIKFECTICDFRCNRYLDMENHKRDEHGYLCSICQQCFGDWAEMKAHTLHDHGGYLTSDANATYIESPRVWVMFKGE